MYAYVVRLDGIVGPFDTGWIHWLVFVIAFALAEGQVVHLNLGRESHSLSFNEIPLVLGLFYLTPGSVVAAMVVGSAIALVLLHEQLRQPIKLVFNTASFWLGADLAALAFHALVGPDRFAVPVSWLAALLAAVIASAVNFGAVLAAVNLSESRPDRSRVAPFAAGLLIESVTATSLALIAIVLVRANPIAAVLMVVPIIGVYIAFHAYSAERDRHESLEVLYESVRILQDTPEVGRALTALLAELRTTFRSEVAEATLLVSDVGDRLLRTTVTDGVEGEQLETVAAADLERPLLDAVSGRQRVMVTADDGGALSEYLAYRGLRDAMIVPLHGEEHVVGALMLANRVGQVSPYREEELQLLQTLAENASVSLRGTQVEDTLSELHSLKEELRHQTYHDPLTGLANRSLFTARVREAVTHTREAQSPAVLSLNIDDFKGVNDTLGHEAGDALLIEVAERLRRCARPGDLAARLSADEFAVLVSEAPDAELPLRIADRIAFAMRLPVYAAGRELDVRLSIGVAVGAGESANDLIRNADIAMYRAKHDPHTRFAVYDPEMGAAVAERLALRAQLLTGVESEQFRVHYQPFVRLESGAITGFEALVRWQHPDKGLVAPDEFISLAEETGLVIPIGELVLHEATNQLAAWQTRDPGLVMSVNLSARQLKHESLVQGVHDAIAASGIEPHTLILEITERDVMDDTEASQERLRSLKTLGVQLAIDDFGTGYSSLAYLHRFPFDMLKVAKPFIDALETGERDAALAHAVIEMGQTLGLDTVAEGIETARQRDQLVKWGCVTGQGWHFAPALPADEVVALLDGPALLSGLVHRAEG